ncbi:DUF1045 domain-containing protein [Terasakiella sp. A23]|uniref:DUF1045 domain-containing protein n=1 Tax=Terasakiella sp. FCG-A23 TaxID=3080561 RepID=UPI002954D074|nr:DUF1045 domain-containing protein [Terasakiella sp. A23]MDV7340335.1 DUF1045 domain-containing protein [Terasakiella sp. A23]
MEYERFALYYAPPKGAALADFGNSWLGWDAENQREVDRPVLKGISADDIARITTAPSRYGFHGTLKPPFRLKEGKTIAQLDSAISDLAKSLSFIVCGPLQLKQIGRFLALVPTNCNKALARFAGNCVMELDDFRAAPTEAELVKRRKANLTARQEELLQQWGYPYVMDEFRFHLTLTDQLEEAELSSVRKQLHGVMPHILTSPLEIKEICLFGDPGNGQSFHLVKRYSC